MIYFADPHPEELLFSAWVRSAERLRYPNKHRYFAEFSGQLHTNPIIDFPCHLNQFVAALPAFSSYSADTLIQDHTLYHYYRPFLPYNRAQMLYESMCGGNGQQIYWHTNLMNSQIPRRGWFRYCPSCVMEDRATYGECYWHRLHQIHGVLVCPKHHLMLESCNPEEQDLASRVLVPADQLLYPKSIQRVSTLSDMEIVERIATQIAFLLEHTQPTIDLHHRYHLLLEQHHFLKSNGTVRITDVAKAFEGMFPRTLLQSLRCAFDPQMPPYMTWLSRLLGKQTLCQHPLLHILTIIFLQGSVEEFFRPLKPMPGPFGSGPWPCLNPACPNYHHLVITECQVFHKRKFGCCTGHFTCSCGFKYMRIQREDMDPYEKDSTLSFGTLWTQKLRDLWADGQLSIHNLSEQMGVSEMALQRQVTLLGLPTRAQELSSTAHRKRQQRIEADRQMWLTALMEDAHLPRKQFWQKFRKIGYRLHRHDHEWFEAHSLPPALRGQVHPPPRSPRWMPKEPINWSERDIILAETIHQIATTMKNAQEKLKRVTLAQLKKEIPELRWFRHRKIDQYPRSHAMLEAVLETKEMFILRKIHWLMHRCEEQHIWPGQRRFLDASGAYSYLDDEDIKEKVNQVLMHLSDVFPDKRVTLLC
jgi:hypothetical protein